MTTTTDGTDGTDRPTDEKLLDRIAEIAAMPDIAPEAKRLLEMAAKAQETGKMPSLDFCGPLA